LPTSPITSRSRRPSTSCARTRVGDMACRPRQPADLTHRIPQHAHQQCRHRGQDAIGREGRRERRGVAKGAPRERLLRDLGGCLQDQCDWYACSLALR
jgi:hypothetical protein